MFFCVLLDQQYSTYSFSIAKSTKLVMFGLNCLFNCFPFVPTFCSSIGMSASSAVILAL